MAAEHKARGEWRRSKAGLETPSKTAKPATANEPNRRSSHTKLGRRGKIKPEF